MQACPSDTELARYYSRSLDDAKRGGIERHLSECEACRKREAEYRGGDDALFQQLREADETLSETQILRNDAPASIPQRIGQYRIKRIIASGGMGTVYEAVQEQPRRVVALKVMKAGIASKSALRRFEYESQILARLRHPNIAQVYEAGTHTPSPSKGERMDQRRMIDQSRDREGAVIAEGVPFFAMEYIPNARPVTDHAKEKQLGTKERLQLFTQVTAAIHHGHQKGIIHRDLKPGNILVDSQGQVKIIDFGVARATDSDMAITTLQTDVGQLIGTLQYMSPEQCDADPHDLDVRSDVYALGVVLYELLCDQLPYDVRAAAIYEAARIIREEQPKRPSTVSRALRGDIETIALKALEKDRTRRYQSADEFGTDIHRYLAGEPISARPPSVIYQLRVFARRNKAAFAAIAAVFVILTAATIFSSVQYFKADAARADAVAAWGEQSRERERAVRERERAEQEAERARLAEAEQSRARKEAEKERDKAEAINEFVTKALVSSDPHQGGAQGFLVTDAMEQAVKQLDTGELKDQPETEAALRLTIAHILHGNARSQEALGLAEQALDINQRLHSGDHPAVARSLNELACCLNHLGRPANALPRYEAALEMRQRLFAGDHPHVATSLNNVALCLQSLGRSAEALPKHEAALEMCQRLFEGDHPDVALGLNSVAYCLQSLGRSAEALPKHEAALEMYQRLFEGDHPQVANSLNNVAACLQSLGRSAEALPKFEAALEMHQRLFKGDHPEMAIGLNNVAYCLQSLGRSAEALPKFEEALEIRRRLFEGDHPAVAASLNDVAGCLQSLSRSAEALSQFEAALEMRRRLFDGDHPSVAVGLNNVAGCLQSLGRSAEALTKYQAAIEMLRRVLPAGHPNTLYPHIGLAKTLVALGRRAEAEPLLLDAAAQCEQSEASRRMHWQSVMKAVVELYDAWHAAEPDEGYDAKAAEWRTKLNESTKPPATEESNTE